LLCSPGDRRWDTAFVDPTTLQGEEAKLRRRLGTVNGFSLYCDNPRNPDWLLTRFFAGAAAESGARLAAAFEALPASHAYLLAPVDTQVMLWPCFLLPSLPSTRVAATNRASSLPVRCVGQDRVWAAPAPAAAAGD
jgi:hypothetical protein